MHLERQHLRAQRLRTTISISDIIIDLTNVQSDYFTVAVSTCIPSVYMKTQSFNFILEKVQVKLTELTKVQSNSLRCSPILMKRPKGVGKTMCLLALLCVLAVGNTIAVFIIGHNYGSADHMRYLEGLASRFDIVIEPNTIFKDFLKRFIQFARQKYQVLLLMDFDNFSDVRNLVEMVEVVKVAVVAKVVTVLAVSSGRGSNALHLGLTNFLSL